MLKSIGAILSGVYLVAVFCAPRNEQDREKRWTREELPSFSIADSRKPPKNSSFHKGHNTLSDRTELKDLRSKELYSLSPVIDSLSFQNVPFESDSNPINVNLILENDYQKKGVKSNKMLPNENETDERLIHDSYYYERPNYSYNKRYSSLPLPAILPYYPRFPPPPPPPLPTLPPLPPPPPPPTLPPPPPLPTLPPPPPLPTLPPLPSSSPPPTPPSPPLQQPPNSYTPAEPDHPLLDNEGSLNVRPPSIPNRSYQYQLSEYNNTQYTQKNPLIYIQIQSELAGKTEDSRPYKLGNLQTNTTNVDYHLSDESSNGKQQNNDQHPLHIRFANGTSDQKLKSTTIVTFNIDNSTTRPLIPIWFQAAAVTPEN